MIHKNAFQLTLFIIAGAVLLGAIGLLLWSDPRSEEVAGEETSVLQKCQQKPTLAEADECYFDEARNTSSAAPCNLIQDAELKEQCNVGLAMKNGDPAQCFETQSDLVRDKCIQDVAFNLRNPGQCSVIINPDRQKQCVQDVAEVLENADVCMLVRDVGKRQDCKDAIATSLDEKRGVTPSSPGS